MLSARFGFGGLVAACLAQWAPKPLTSAYLPHLVLTAMAVGLALRLPETVPARGPDGRA